MKKLLSLFIFIAICAVGTSTSHAQENISYEKIFEQAQNKALIIADKIDLNQNEQQLLVRQIVSREQTLAKIEQAKNDSNASKDYSKYISEINEQFETNIKDLFSTDKAKLILSLYEIKEKE